MKIFQGKDYEEISLKAAKIIAAQIYLKPNSVLGLATGSTPLRVYEELVRLHKVEGLDFSAVTTFNLDEYVGLEKEDKNSYRYYMWENLFKHINISPENIHIPDGMTKSIPEECEAYEVAIEKAGGMDLLILGIGENGHIGFNEPDDKFQKKTHLVKLDEDTIRANARFFHNEKEVPRYAISMGIGTILKAKKILLLASGGKKAEAISQTTGGVITPDEPASILQLHSDVTLLLDRESAAYIGEGEIIK